MIPFVFDDITNHDDELLVLMEKRSHMRWRLVVLIAVVFFCITVPLSAAVLASFDATKDQNIKFALCFVLTFVQSISIQFCMDIVKKIRKLPYKHNIVLLSKLSKNDAEIFCKENGFSSRKVFGIETMTQYPKEIVFSFKRHKDAAAFKMFWG